VVAGFQEKGGSGDGNAIYAGQVSARALAQGEPDTSILLEAHSRRQKTVAFIIAFQLNSIRKMCWEIQGG
jgi:hypothetical protein